MRSGPLSSWEAANAERRLQTVYKITAETPSPLGLAIFKGIDQSNNDEIQWVPDSFYICVPHR